MNHRFQNGKTNCGHMSKTLSDNSTIFATEATAITVALACYRHINPIQQDVVIHSMSCLQASWWRAKILSTLSFIYFLCVGRQRQMHPFLLGANPWRHCGWKENRPVGIRNCWQWPRAYVQCRFEAASSLLYAIGGSNQVGDSERRQILLSNMNIQNSSPFESIPH